MWEPSIKHSVIQTLSHYSSTSLYLHTLVPLFKKDVQEKVLTDLRRGNIAQELIKQQQNGVEGTEQGSPQWRRELGFLENA